LRDDKEKFDKLDAVVFGINSASPESHKKYSEKFGFNFPLLSDGEMNACSLFDAKGMLKSIKRTVVIIDKKGVVRYFKYGMPADDELLEAIKNFEL